jgi:uncharacterized protein YbcC (UPF0753/DUF2309 family)
LIEQLNLSNINLKDYFFQLLWQLKGWVGYIKWTNTYPENPWVLQRTSIIDIVIVWLCYEWAYQSKMTTKMNVNSVSAYCSPAEIDNVWIGYLSSIKSTIDAYLAHMIHLDRMN